MAQALNRAANEAKRLPRDLASNPGITCEPDEIDYRHFRCTIAGPADTPFEGGIFPVEIFCPEEYPTKPPKCLFRCKIYHPNVNKHGQICLSILKVKTNEMSVEEQKDCWMPGRKII